MPELPETETIARQLDARLRGARLLGARVARPSVLREVDAETLDRRVAGAAVARVWRRAKLVVLDLSTGDRLVVQPRFTGALLLEGPGVDFPEAERRFVRATFPLDGAPAGGPVGGPPPCLHYRDIRTLGTLALMGPERFAEYTAALGPEPLDAAFTGDRLRERLAGSRQAIKKVLMDQRRLAGVGNIYANEALLQARIAPTRPANSLTAAEGERLRDALADRLARSVAMGGTTFENFVTPLGGRGGFVAELRAYGKAGAPCPHCDRPLTGTHAVDGRATVYCAGCQR